MTLVRPTPLRADDIAEYARGLLAAHGLSGWSFAFNRSKVNLGLCLYGPRVIELSLNFVQRNSADAIRDTLLHEIAHALVGRPGHDVVWQQMCLQIGARPERLSFEADMPAGLWQARCGSCGLLHHKHRKPKWMKGWFCKHCGREQGRLEWARTC